MRISDWSSDVCSSDLVQRVLAAEDHRRALEQAELVLARQLAEGDDRARERNGADKSADEQFQAIAHGQRCAGRRDAEGVRFGERTSVVKGKSVSVRLDRGGRRIIKKKKKKQTR